MTAKPNLSTQLKHLVGDQQPARCIQCGKCTSCCPVARFLNFNPRRIVAMVQLNMIELLKSNEIWLCTLCLKCKESCPREVTPYDTLQALRNLTVCMGLPFPKEYSDLINSILKQGIIQPPLRVRTRTHEHYDRQSLSLPNPQRPHVIEKFVEALNKTIKWGEASG